MTAPKQLSPVAVLKAPRSNKLLILFARSVLHAMRDNPNFPDAGSELDEFELDLDDFAASEVTALGKAVGAAQLRDARRLTVIQGLHHLRDHVQKVSEKRPLAEAITVILSANMRPRQATRRAKEEFAVKQGERSGVVVLSAKAVGHSAVYYWQFSVDQESWVDVDETMQAETTITGLTPGQVYYFRMQTRTRKGPRSNFTQVVSLRVL